MSTTSETLANNGETAANNSTESLHSSVIQVKANENTGITKLNDYLTDTNYNTWKGQMMLTLEICGVEKYALGDEEKPDAETD